MSRNTAFPVERSSAFVERAAVWLRGAILASAVGAASVFLYRSGTPQQEPTLLEAQRSCWPGVRLPPTRTAEGASIRDDEEVIGVVVGEHARAYVVRAMDRLPSRHVVNDVLGIYPVSVTYCGRTNCSRAFSGPPTGEPLEIDVGGWKENGLTLRVGSDDYAQRTGANIASSDCAGIPYAELPSRRTTWGAWRAAHPDTDVYVGDVCEAALARTAHAAKPKVKLRLH